MEHKQRNTGIIHNPLGNEQPYFQKINERFPRYPRAGEPVTVGCFVEPVPAEIVQLQWSRDNWERVQTVKARCIGNTDSVGHDGHEHYWLAAVPGIVEGTVQYRFVAFTGQERVESEIYRYSVGRTVICDRFSISNSSGDGCELVSSPSNGNESMLFRLTAEPDRLRMDVRVLKGAPDGAGTDTSCNFGDYELELTPMPGNGEPKAGSGFSLVERNSGKVLVESSGPCRIHVGQECDWQVEFGFHSPENESFFGFGERYNGLNQRGEIISNVVFEQYKNQQLKSYLPIPFFFTSGGRAFYTADDHCIEYDLCATEPGRAVISWSLGESDILENYIFSGSSLEMVRKFADCTVMPVMPPSWVFGPWMSSNEWNSQERVLFEARKSIELDIPATVLVIEAWSDETTFYIWNGATYETRNADEPFRLEDFSFAQSAYWSDPKAMSDELHELGMKLVLWQIPVVKASSEENAQHALDWEHAASRDLIVREDDGSPHHSRPGWFKGSLLPDFTNPECAEWWFGKREYLVRECGVDGFKTDGGEQLWGERTRFSNGRQGNEMINRFPVEYLKAYHEFLDRELSGEGATFSRSGYRGVQAFPVHWAGDQGSTWDAFRGVIPAVLNAGLSGVPFIGWDIGGFSGEVPSSELYLRSTAAAAFSPVMQYHSEFHDHTEPHVDRTPWNIAERNGNPEVVDIYRMYAKLRMAILPYIMQEAAHCCQTGEPMMRPLFLDFPADAECLPIEDTYLFGRALLVAPLLQEGLTDRAVYLPQGNWVDCWNGEQFRGPRKITCSAPLDIIPLFRRDNALWPLEDNLFQNAINALREEA